MKKYIITIVDLRSGESEKFVDHLSTKISEVAIRYLGGTDNIIYTTMPNYDCIGILKDSPKSFSILCYTPNN